MKRIVVIMLISVFILSSVCLMAGRFPHRRTGISIWFPKHWEVRQVGEAFYGISPDGQAVVQYIQLPARRMGRGKVAFRPSLEPQIQDFQKTANGPRFTRNGLVFRTIYGTARHKRRLWAVAIYFVETPRGVAMLVQRHVKNVGTYKVPFTNILESLKPL
jgi:hypothetical protein